MMHRLMYKIEEKLLDRLAGRLIDSALCKTEGKLEQQEEEIVDAIVDVPSIDESSLVRTVFDFHNDILTSDQSDRYKLEYVVQQSKRAGLVLVLWTTKHALTLSQVRDVLQPYIELSLPNIVLSIEDINIVEDSAREIAMLPFGLYGIVWNNTNRYAGGCYDTLGLSKSGTNLVRTLLEYNKVVDVAHTSRASFWDILDCTQGKNIVCSHTCFDNVFQHVRNLDAAQCQALVDCNSLIGCTFVKDLLGGDTVDHVIRHIDWFVNKWGVDNLCVGTDYFGTTHFVGLDTYELVATNIRNRLVKLGYKDSDIHKILYSNLATKLAELNV